MKAVFSFWSKPSKGSLHKRFAGFPDKGYFDTAFRLALLTAKKNFTSTQLVTDTEGYKMLVLDMGLAFDEVSLALDDIADMPANLWMFGKLKAYSIQTGPFVHLDFDMFLLKPVPSWFKCAEIVVQSVEPFRGFEFYRWGVDWVRSTHRKLPFEFDAFKNVPFEEQLAHNVGMIGGQNWQAITDYATKAIRLINDNISLIKQLPDYRVSEVNVIYEQYFLSAYARYHNIEVKNYVENILDEAEMLEKGYVHLLGDNKSNRQTCEQMAITYAKMRDGTREFAY